MTNETEPRKLELQSHLSEFKVGEVVRVIGIASSVQDEVGRILRFEDANIPIIYISLNRTPPEIRSYFQISGKVWEGRRAEELYDLHSRQAGVQA